MDKFTAFVLKVSGTLTAIGILSTAGLIYSIGQQLAVLQDQMARLDQRTAGLYTERRAEREFGDVRRELERLGMRIDENSRRLDTFSNRMRELENE
ncbi:hypothetical protein J2T57_002597 [Natronocella acetinitrilica]|uniref:Uncharacterized protein n=1 Tax=Natronocella acetinitrilica TaxID=414046 RepID=A0AAE3G7Y9_9GAMM|nr:hypothetical protein [Natronocella acetinitrilica]MCP1675447.1 hypothetical protein [Natronocella acetinitrilica]